MARLSVVLVTRNEEHNIDRCLGSVAWADEIVVVDSFSTDGTVARARAHTDRVFRHEYDGYSRQVERGVGYATGDWVLVLDADEEVSPRLADQIRGVVAAESAAPDGPVGYRLRRHLRAYGFPVVHGGQAADWPLRLFRRERGRPQHREIHGAYAVDGAAGRLDGGLWHHSYDHVYAHVARVNDYTSLEVTNRLARDPDARARWWNVLVNPAGAFLRAYLARQGWRDGFAGFALALLTALYTQLTYLKLWEYRLRRGEAGDRRPPIRAAEVTVAKIRS